MSRRQDTKYSINYMELKSYLKVRRFFKIGWSLVSIASVIFHFSSRKFLKSFTSHVQHHLTHLFAWHDQEPELRLFYFENCLQIMLLSEGYGQNWDDERWINWVCKSKQTTNSKTKWKWLSVFFASEVFKCILRWKLQSQSLRTIIIFEWRNSSSLEATKRSEKRRRSFLKVETFGMISKAHWKVFDTHDFFSNWLIEATR